MHPLLIEQQRLHTEGTQLLEETLIPTLKKFGDLHLEGSYVYKLLAHPDIDIAVLNPDVSRELFASLASEILKLPIVSKFRANDKVLFQQTHGINRPTGYWICPLIEINNTTWTIDIWFQKPEWYKPTSPHYQKKLTGLSDEQRITILSLKNELRTVEAYGVGKEFQSVDVYEAVVNHNARSITDMRVLKKN